MIDFGFGEQNVPFVVFFRHVVLLLFASILLLRALLRFEANLFFLLGGS